MITALCFALTACASSAHNSSTLSTPKPTEIAAPTDDPNKIGFANSPEEREAFQRHKLMEVALAQTKGFSGYWDPAQRDCAGFVRFIFRSAVPSAQPLWIDRASKPAAFVSAAELVAYNFRKQSDVFDESKIKTGDLLVFHRPDRKPEDAWHLMVVLAPPPYGPPQWLAIYHNGDRTPEGGALRVVALNDLQSTVHTEWRPDPKNSSFRGVFRWNGWKTP